MNAPSSTRDRLPRRLMMIAAVIWLAFAALLLVILADYIAQGAGGRLFGDLQLFGFIDIAARLLIGWIHVLGIFIGSIVSFSIGLILLSYASPSASPSRVHDEVLD